MYVFICLDWTAWNADLLDNRKKKNYFECILTIQIINIKLEFCAIFLYLRDREVSKFFMFELIT